MSSCSMMIVMLVPCAVTYILVSIPIHHITPLQDMYSALYLVANRATSIRRQGKIGRSSRISGDPLSDPITT